MRKRRLATRTDPEERNTRAQCLLQGLALLARVTHSPTSRLRLL